MFGFGKKKENKEVPQDFVYDQALIVRIPQAEELGEEGALEKIIEFEEEAVKILPPKSGVDGHEFGDNEALIYIYGPDADKLYKTTESLLSRYFAGQGADITLQYGLPQNQSTREKKIHF